MNPLQLMELAKIHYQETQKNFKNHHPPREGIPKKVTRPRLLDWLVTERQDFFMKLDPKQLQERA